MSSPEESVQKFALVGLPRRHCPVILPETVGKSNVPIVKGLGGVVNNLQGGDMYVAGGDIPGIHRSILCWCGMFTLRHLQRIDW
jgi:hypothetical protein